MKTPSINRIELHKHLFLSHYCAQVFLEGSDKAVARIDDGVIKYKSTIGSRCAGVDKVLANVNLDSLLKNPLTIVK